MSFAGYGRRRQCDGSVDTGCGSAGVGMCIERMADGAWADGGRGGCLRVDAASNMRRSHGLLYRTGTEGARLGCGRGGAGRRRRMYALNVDVHQCHIEGAEAARVSTSCLASHRTLSLTAHSESDVRGAVAGGGRGRGGPDAARHAGPERSKTKKVQFTDVQSVQTSECPRPRRAEAYALGIVKKQPQAAPGRQGFFSDTAVGRAVFLPRTNKGQSEPRVL